MKTKWTLLTAVLASVLVCSANANIIDSITPTQSTFVQSNNPGGDIKGSPPSSGFLEVKYISDGPAIGSWNRKAYTKFDLGDLDSGPYYQLDLDFVDSGKGATPVAKQWDFTLYGFADSSDLSTLTWNNAPQNDTNSGSGFLSGAMALANFQVTGKGIGTLSIVDSRLTNFVSTNQGTGVVIFTVGRDTQGLGSSSTSYVHAFAASGSEGAPTLSAVPAPSVIMGLFSLLTTGSVVYVARRRR